MLASGTLGTHHGHDELDLAAVNRVELDAFRNGQHGGDLLLEVGREPVRDRHAFADARRLQRLALEQHMENVAGLDGRAVGEQRCDLSQHARFVEDTAGRPAKHANSVFGEQLAQFHGFLASGCG